jgi:hypothetical protein
MQSAMKRNSIVLIIVSLFLIACTPKQLEDKPSYILVNNPKLITNPIIEGSNSNALEHIWFFVENENRGPYGLNREFPVMRNGVLPITILPGVLENGIRATRVPYPFYTNYLDTIAFQPEQTTIIEPTFYYKDNVNFNLIENLEGSVLRFEPGETNNSLFGITRDPSEVYDGTGSLKIRFENEENLLNIRSRDWLVLPRNKGVWAEIDYKSDIKVDVGLAANTGNNNILINLVAGFNPTNGEWRKIYFNFTNTVSELPEQYTYKLIFYSTEENIQGKEVFLDNIKLLSFE